MQLDLFCVVTQGFMKLLLARYFLRHVELPADFTIGFEQGHVMTALGSDGGEAQASRTSAHHSKTLRLLDWWIIQLGFVASAWIHQARSDSTTEGMIQAGLIAGNTDVDLICPALLCLTHEKGV